MRDFVQDLFWTLRPQNSVTLQILSGENSEIIVHVERRYERIQLFVKNLASDSVQNQNIEAEALAK